MHLAKAWARVALLALLVVLVGRAPASAEAPRPKGPYKAPPSRVWPRVAVVCIDSASVKRLGGFPFDRAVHARLLARLLSAGARLVAFDLYFGDAGTPSGDLAFARAIARSRRTWLIASPLSQKASDPARPLALFAQAAGWRVGVPSIEQGEHFVGGVRVSPVGTAKMPHLLMGLMTDALRLRRWPRAAGPDATWVGDWRLPTPGGVFTSEPSDTRRLAIDGDSRIRLYSYARVLSGEVSLRELDGAIVLVGVTPSPRNGEELIFEDWSIPAWVMKAHVEALAILLEKMFRALDHPTGRP